MGTLQIGSYNLSLSRLETDSTPNEFAFTRFGKLVALRVFIKRDCFSDSIFFSCIDSIFFIFSLFVVLLGAKNDYNSLFINLFFRLCLASISSEFDYIPRSILLVLRLIFLSCTSSLKKFLNLSANYTFIFKSSPGLT